MHISLSATDLLIIAAQQLGEDERLYDPSDDDILLAAAELAEDLDLEFIDLDTVSAEDRQRIVEAYDRAHPWN